MYVCTYHIELKSRIKNENFREIIITKKFRENWFRGKNILHYFSFYYYPSMNTYQSPVFQVDGDILLIITVILSKRSGGMRKTVSFSFFSFIKDRPPGSENGLRSHSRRDFQPVKKYKKKKKVLYILFGSLSLLLTRTKDWVFLMCVKALKNKREKICLNPWILSISFIGLHP